MNIPRTIKKFFEANKTAIVSIGILVVVISGLLFGIIPASQASLGLFEQNNVLSEEIRALSGKTAILEGLSQSSLRQNLADAVAAVPPDQSVPTILATLDGVAAQSGVELADIELAGSQTVASPSAEGKAGPPTSKPGAPSVAGANAVKFSVSVRGAYGQIAEFFRLAAGVRRFMSVKSFDMTIDATASAQAKVGMETYYVAFPVTIGAVGSKIEALTNEETATIQKLSGIPNLTVAAQLPEASFAGPAKSDPFSP